MAVEDLFQMSAMLKVQLPFLFSFAVMRWLMGIAFGGVGGWVVRRFGCGHHLPSITGALSQVRALIYVVALACLSTAWVQQWALHGPPSVCGPHVCTRVQGMAAGTGVLILMTNGNSLALGLALATLKAVADTSASSTMLASIAVLFAVRRGPTVGACVSMTSGALVSFVFGCWRGEHGQRYTEGATMALLVMAMYVLVRACVLVGSSAVRSGTRGGRVLLRMPARMFGWVLKGRRAL